MASQPDDDSILDEADDILGGDLGDILGGAIDLGEDIDPLAEDPEDTPDPLADVQYTDDLATDAALELDALQQGYRARAAAEVDRFREATDSEYWVAIVFRNREDKDAFLVKHGLAKLGDKYLRGDQVDKVLSR